MSQSANVEPDSRFPSGKWIGFFLDRRIPGRHSMELTLTFSAGTMTGDGRDRVGTFTIDGKYEVSDGKCEFVKRYVKAHVIDYRGFNEGKGIWGTWELRQLEFVFTGGFHIWPEGMADPTQRVLEEEADIPIETPSTEREPELIPF